MEEQGTEQPKFWESDLSEVARAELYTNGYTLFRDGTLYVPYHGFRFIDECQSDSYGPFDDKEACLDAAVKYWESVL